MSLRQLQRKAADVLRNGDLLKAIQSEIAHELSSSPPPPSSPLPSQDDARFKVDWDDARTQDVLLKRRNDKEEISVWALMRSVRFEEEVSESNPNPEALPGEVVMKVCIKKIGFDPVVHFDCKVFDGGFRVRSVYYHGSMEDLGENKYKGPQFSTLDPKLRKALKEYLLARGINDQLTSFLLQHLVKKEHSQYVNWLRNLEGLFTNDD